MNKPFLTRLLLSLACLLLPAAARAQGKPNAHASAEALKREGDDNIGSKHYVEALDDYERAYALEPNPALHYNRGRALEFLARYPEAVDAFARFQAEAPPALMAKVPDLDAHVADLKAKVATVTITANVPGTRILLGGTEVGRAPLPAAVRRNAGTTTLEAFADGYVDYRKEVDLKGGATTALDVQLVSRDTMSYLVVKSPVAGARVSVDGKAVGLVPAEVKLAPGTHPVVLDHEGYSDAKTQVVLRASERREISVDLSKARSITSRWWFWTGIGVVVVGAASAAVVYALTTERAPPSGNFSPGQLAF